MISSSYGIEGLALKNINTQKSNLLGGKYVGKTEARPLSAERNYVNRSTMSHSGITVTIQSTIKS